MLISEKAYNQNRKRSSKKANSANENGIINQIQFNASQVKSRGGGGGGLKIFICLCLAKIPDTIHHNQLLLCRRILQYVN